MPIELETSVLVHVRLSWSIAFHSLLLTDEYCDVYVIYEEHRRRPLAWEEKVVPWRSGYHK
jgi:hypothetical protein